MRTAIPSPAQDLASAAAPAASPGNLTVIDWRPVARHTLRGFATLRVNAWHLVVADVAIHEKNGQRWAQLPAKPILDKDRQAVLTDDDNEVRRRFSVAVVDAVAAFDSTAFAAGEP